MTSYADIKKWRHQEMRAVSTNHQQLNEFHDEIMKATVQIAIKKVQSERGEPPAPFVFFLMGSAGRFEQSVWSDQDHGIIFNGDDYCEPYFLALGKEITEGLAAVDYELCDGKVMALNPRWCQSLDKWETQITEWLQEASWESLRHFCTFFDSRVFIGDEKYLDDLKDLAFNTIEANPKLNIRFVENVEFIKKGIGVLGQLLPELHGTESGSIQLKQTTFYPYVNALRLLALKNQVYTAPTLLRFRELKKRYEWIEEYETFFERLLEFRLHFRRDADDYDAVHLLPLELLNKDEKQELKKMMKKGYKLLSEVKSTIEKECSP
ncbi:DUF294 nucleotidyltransferase-like domain-containing protein [Radiobacillus sp. PE A8.2]|uniref:DUF294 nucleotidyltransferase-like domain-containing protein n=1 Tax=Radiobacillus sp. PE A8.2 TaxID=3380349 RepID=UPI003890BBFF